MNDMQRKNIPVGITEFEEIREKDYYYIDKTGLIKEFFNLSRPPKVSLFTRPRRFGKTLFMNMLKSFFEIGTDPMLFDSLAIGAEKKNM
jgi:hypothetical protein